MNKRILISTVLGWGLPLVALAQPQWQGNSGNKAVVYNGPVVNFGTEAPPLAPPPVSPAYPAPVQHLQAPAEIDPANDPHQRGLSLGGPRFGASYLTGGGYDKLKEVIQKAKPGTEVDPIMTQFGWQMEYRLFRTEKGVTALTEFIPLIGGMDQGLALPSATFLVGLRTKHGYELGVGPNVGLDGVSMMIGAGHTFDLGGINIPLNVAYGRGGGQTGSLSFSVGFNL